MSGCKRRSQRSHCIGKSCLVHGDYIHVALAQDQVIFPGGSGYIQSVQITALVKNTGLCRIQVLGLAVSHHSPAKSNHPVIDIHDWKNNTIPEFVIHALAFIHIEKAGFPKKFITVILGFQIFIQVITVLV